MATRATHTSNAKSDLGEIYARLGDTEKDIAVLHREMSEVKAGQSRLEDTMEQHGELLHAIRADLKISRFPGIERILQTVMWGGGAIAMCVTAITYITSHFIGAELSPRIVALEKQNFMLEYRLERIEKPPQVLFRSGIN